VGAGREIFKIDCTFLGWPGLAQFVWLVGWPTKK
jgi:hypothetical protein